MYTLLKTFTFKVLFPPSGHPHFTTIGNAKERGSKAEPLEAHKAQLFNLKLDSRLSQRKYDSWSLMENGIVKADRKAAKMSQSLTSYVKGLL